MDEKEINEYIRTMQNMLSESMYELDEGEVAVACYKIGAVANMLFKFRTDIPKED